VMPVVGSVRRTAHRYRPSWATKINVKKMRFRTPWTPPLALPTSRGHFHIPTLSLFLLVPILLILSDGRRTTGGRVMTETLSLSLPLSLSLYLSFSLSLSLSLPPPSLSLSLPLSFSLSLSPSLFLSLSLFLSSFIIINVALCVNGGSGDAATSTKCTRSLTLLMLQLWERSEICCKF
jgi:hypothetical protein